MRVEDELESASGADRRRHSHGESGVHEPHVPVHAPVREHMAQGVDPGSGKNREGEVEFICGKVFRRCKVARTFDKAHSKSDCVEDRSGCNLRFSFYLIWVIYLAESRNLRKNSILIVC